MWVSRHQTVTSGERPELTKTRNPLRLTPSTALVCSLHDPRGSVRASPPFAWAKWDDATVDVVITRPLTVSHCAVYLPDPLGRRAGSAGGDCTLVARPRLVNVFTRSAARVSARRFICVEERRFIDSGFYVAG